MKRAAFLYLSLIAILMGKGVIVYAQEVTYTISNEVSENGKYHAYTGKGSITKNLYSSLPNSSCLDTQSCKATPLSPGLKVIDCKTTADKCGTSSKQYNDAQTSGYIEVEFIDKSGKKVIGYINDHELNDPSTRSVLAPAPPVITQATVCAKCDFENKNTIKEKALEKHDEDQKAILTITENSPPAKGNFWCGNTKKSKGENLWNQIGNSRKPDAAPKCEAKYKICKHDNKSEACKAAKASCAEATATCRKVISNFEEHCDIFAGLDVQGRIANIWKRVDPVLDSLPAGLHPPILSKELIVCIMRREGPNFRPSQPSEEACYDRDADDFGLGQIRVNSLDYYWDWYNLKLPSEIRAKYGTARSLYFGMPEDIDAQIKMIALFINAKYLALIGRGDGKDKRGQPIYDGCNKVKGAQPISFKQRASDKLNGRSPWLRKTIRGYDNCGIGGYPDDIFSCMDNLKGKSDAESIRFLAPGVKPVVGDKR